MPTSDDSGGVGRSRRARRALQNMRGPVRRVGIPQHSSRAFDDEQTKYINELEEYLKFQDNQIRSLEFLVQSFERSIANLGRHDNRLKQLEQRADAGGI